MSFKSEFRDIKETPARNLSQWETTSFPGSSLSRPQERETGREGEDPGSEVDTIAGLSKLCDAGGGSKILQGEGGVNLYLKNNEAMGQAY